MNDGPTFQDMIKDNHCWGCGSFNDHGLHIESRWQGEEAVCTWQPQEHHSAGPRHIVNGGIIATIMDCHCVCAAMADAYRTEGRELGSAPEIWYATGSLHVTYLRPAPISGPVTLTARVQQRSPRRTTVVCSLYSGQQECARGEVVAVRVPDGWREEGE